MPDGARDLGRDVGHAGARVPESRSRARASRAGRVEPSNRVALTRPEPVISVTDPAELVVDYMLDRDVIGVDPRHLVPTRAPRGANQPRLSSAAIRVGREAFDQIYP